MVAYVYVIGTIAGRRLTYVGWTLDLDRRLAEHNGQSKGAKSTRARKWNLLYAEKHRTRKGAMKREYFLKQNRKLRTLLRGKIRPRSTLSPL